MQIGAARELHDLVCQTRVSTAPSIANWLQHQLQLNKRSLLDLLDDLPKNAQDRKTLQEGRANINNTIHKVNDEFIKEALFVSDQLGLNEHVAASLLLAGVAAAPRTNSTTIDAAITAYHVERGYLLACLDIILKSAKDASVRQDIRLVFRQFAAELVRERVSAEGAMGTFPTKLVKTLKKVTATHNTLTTTGSIPQQQQQQQPQPQLQQQHQPFQLNQQQQQQQPQTPQPSKEQQGTTVSSGRLGEQITSFRLERLMDERLGVAQILYHITSLFWLEPDDVLLLNDTLQLSELSDIAIPYMLLALVAALSATNHTDSDPPALYNNVDFMRKFHDRMLKKSWKVPAVKAVAMVQWILFQYNAVQMDRTIEQRLPDKLDNLDKLIYEAITSKAFEFMNEYMLYFQQKNASIDTDRGLFKLSLYDDKDVTTVDPSDFTKFNADIRLDFQMFVVHELEQLTSDFILHLQHILRKLKYREEDTGMPVQQTPISSRSAITTGEDDSNKCRDLERFMDLLASIYRGRINAGWQFWLRSDSHLASFLKWLVEVRQSGTVRATYNFLASISMGDVCAPRAFQELSSGTNRTDLSSSSLFSWGKLFAALQYYAPLLSKPGEEVPPALPDNEEELLVTFLLLLQQVVQYSTDARQTLWIDSLLRAPDSIVGMLSSRTSFGLRAALYGVLAAFCSPWGGGVINSLGRTISEQMWDILENSEFFVTKRQLSNQQQQQQQQQDGFLQSKNQPKSTQYLPGKQPSFLRELALERASKDYKETLAVVKLLGSAIHTISRREELIGGFQPIISSVPWTLGKNNRTPGAEPYVSLVIDDIFVALDSQEYLYPGAKWELAEACLKVFENSILSFDLRQLRQVLAVSSRKAQSQAASYSLALLGHHSVGQSAADMLEPLLLMYLGHPGFTVIVRLLSGHAFANAIFKIIQEGYNGIVTKKEKSPFFVQCVASSLRIINRVLELQDSFCNLLIPNITGLSSRMSSSQFKLGGHLFPPLPSLAPFGQLMLVNANAIVQVAQLVNCEDQEEICYLSTKILQALSLEPHDSNIASSNSGIQAAMGGIGVKLTNVLRGCKDESLILYGFSERLGIDDAEVTTAEDYEYDINNIPFWMAEKTLANKYAFETDFRPTLSSSVRLAIVDLLLKNSALEKPSPTLANFLLGYTGPAWQSSNSLQGLYNDESVRICLHTILDMMNRGITDDSDQEDKPLIATHPVLAEKCYKLIYLLCAKVSTSSVTMRYLQDKDDFFYNHLRALPARFESYSDAYSPVFPGNMACTDNTVFEADFFVVLSQLHQRAWLLKTIALELHVLAGSGQKSNVRRILDVLYGTARINNNNDGTMDVDNELMFNSRRFEQPLVKMLEIVSSLDFGWEDSLKTIKDEELQFFAGFDPSVFIIENERDCAVYDIRAVYQILRQDQANKRQAGMLANDEDNIALEKEMGRILEALVADNHKREIANGKVHCLRAWKQVVQVTLSECFDNFPFETREKIIYDLLSALLPKMKKAAGADVHFLKGFSEVILTLLTRLREDKLRQEVLAANPTASVESTRLPDEKLRFIFNGILACTQEEGTTIAVRGDMYTALVNFLRYVDHSKNEFGATIQKRPYSDIQKQFIDTISVNDKFLDMLCTDATDGLSIWKTTAYVAVDALYVLSSQMRNDAILSFFVKKNFLRYSIDMLRREDVKLLNFLEQPDVPRDDIYIYETKMSLFLRLALSKEGSKLLVENRIIEVLNHCQFINARPEQNLLRAGRAYVESDFNNRYEQLLMPVLKLISALLCTLGHVNVIDKVETWTRKQQEALLYILTDNQQVTISSLTQLKLVTSILYHLSCRQGFFDDLVTRGLNQLHTAMIHLIAKYLIPQKLASQVVPVTEEEINLAEKQVFVCSQRRSICIISKGGGACIFDTNEFGSIRSKRSIYL
ncbi:nucleoporin Nup186/Nup192/Nup205 [Zychaea mexicana]|uniref:nucleoporin Nup186/Nup192/Nup205 n=1 Tax=Zychaea mexicana TaxID=64656 RepID=UPI0022FF0850|nr:nucleoporin Nup186/Nup192/Nup205 [Zychaea mexicana]KAI9495748.1 nucleoporin Nup186/Nup192/Nup205 [Zychaea mexicana]